MATQNEKGHDSDAPPKLQQLPGRSSNKLQGRLYNNAGRGYDRESLQKMSAGGGRTLVTAQEVSELEDGSNEETVVTSAATQIQSKNSRGVQKYISGAVLFLAGVVVGNVVIPLFTGSANPSDSTVTRSADTEQKAIQNKAIKSDNTNTVSDISSITSINGAEEKGGCSVAALKDDAKGCSTTNSTIPATVNPSSPPVATTTGIESITTTTSSAGKAGCSITALANETQGAAKGCSVTATASTAGAESKGTANPSELSSGKEKSQQAD